MKRILVLGLVLACWCAVPTTLWAEEGHLSRLRTERETERLIELDRIRNDDSSQVNYETQKRAMEQRWDEYESREREYKLEQRVRRLEEAR